MKNSEKYKTAQERADAFSEFCTKEYNEPCIDEKCIFKKRHFADDCLFHWLDLEAEYEKPLPCPFCGGRCDIKEDDSDKPFWVSCPDCGYESPNRKTKERAISAHNRVAKAVMESEKEND